jgi:hypothetical protein
MPAVSASARRKWTMQIFSADAVRLGGVVRRARADVQDFGSIRVLKAEVLRRGFHLIRTADQYVVLCHKGDLRIIC